MRILVWFSHVRIFPQATIDIILERIGKSLYQQVQFFLFPPFFCCFLPYIAIMIKFLLIQLLLLLLLSLGHLLFDPLSPGSGEGSEREKEVEEHVTYLTSLPI